jgi:hypothetical protein
MHDRQRGVLRRVVVRTVALEQRAAEHLVGRVGVADRRTTLAPEQRLVPVSDDYFRLVAMRHSERYDPLQHPYESMALIKPRDRRALSEHGIDETVLDAGTHLDPISARLTLDLRTPLLDIDDVLALADHVTARQEPPVVITAIDALYQTPGTTINLNRINHDERTVARPAAVVATHVVGGARWVLRSSVRC